MYITQICNYKRHCWCGSLETNDLVQFDFEITYLPRHSVHRVEWHKSKGSSSYRYKAIKAAIMADLQLH